MDGKLLLLAHAGLTLFLCGLIWTIRLVHYPLFALVGSAQFRAYEASHSNLITLVVGPTMLGELVLSLWLVLARPAGIMAWQSLLGMLLVGIIWASTAFLQVPQHGILSQGFEARAHAFLVSSNWIRTIAWTLRGFLALSMLTSAMK
jgi:hypothetical protein